MNTQKISRNFACVYALILFITLIFPNLKYQTGIGSFLFFAVVLFLLMLPQLILVKLQKRPNHPRTAKIFLGLQIVCGIVLAAVVIDGEHYHVDALNVIGYIGFAIIESLFIAIFSAILFALRSNTTDKI